MYLYSGVHLVDDALHQVQRQRLHQQKLNAVHRQLGALRDGLQRDGPVLCWQPAACTGALCN